MNQLEIIFRAKQVPLDRRDKRYRIMVSLVRSDRPQFWNFHCFNCQSKVVELNNLVIVDMVDFFDPQSMNNASIGRHCKGETANGTLCPFSYFFNMN